MNEIGVRAVRWNAGRARQAADDARSEVRRAAHFALYTARSSWCALTGRHDWSEWRRSSTFFVPPETRWCRRCTGYEYRGSWPAVKVEVGSMARGGWTKDGGL